MAIKGNLYPFNCSAIYTLWVCFTIFMAAPHLVHAQNETLTVEVHVKKIDIDKGQELFEVLKSHLFDLSVNVEFKLIEETQNSSPENDNTPLPSRMGTVLFSEGKIEVTLYFENDENQSSQITIDENQSWTAQCDSVAVMIRSAIISIQTEIIEETTPPSEIKKKVPKKTNKKQETQKTPTEEQQPTTTTPSSATPIPPLSHFVLWGNYSLVMLKNVNTLLHMVEFNGSYLFKNVIGPMVSGGIGFINVSNEIDETVVLIRIPIRLGLMLRRSSKTFSIGAAGGFNMAVTFFNDYKSKSNINTKFYPGSFLFIYSTIRITQQISFLTAIGTDIFFKKRQYFWGDKSLFTTSAIQPYISLGFIWR